MAPQIMKYKNLLMKIIEDCKKKDSRSDMRSIRDAIILEDVYVKPRVPIERRVEFYQSHNMKISFDDIKHILGYFYLLNPRNRMRVLDDAQKIEKLMQSALEGDAGSGSKFKKLQYDIRTRYREINSRMMISLYMFALIGFCKAECNRQIFPQRQLWLRDLSCFDAKNIVMRIFRETSQHRADINVNDLRAAVNETLDADAAKDENDDEEMDSQEAQIQALKFKLEHLRATLSYVEQSLDDMNNNIERRAAEARQQAIAGFFINMNSARYGLLDKVMQVNQSLEKLRRENFQLQPEAKPLQIIIKRMVEFIKSYGFKEIRPLGEICTVKANDLEMMDYIGEPFFDDDETKQVAVISPGWQYGEIVISKPMVQECTETEEA